MRDVVPDAITPARRLSGLSPLPLVLMTTALLLLGVPLFIVLDRARLLPPSLRDRPWPIELVALAGASVLIGYVRATRKRRAWVIAGAIVCAANAVFVIAFGRLTYHWLPPAPSALPIGTRAQALTLTDQRGAPVALVGTDRPMLLVVFRGVWCPYCRSELARLARQVPRFSGAGIRIYGISADPPEALSRLRDGSGLPFSLLSDPHQQATSLCGLSMHCILLFDRQGVLRWGGFSESWRSPPRYEEVLQAAYRL